MAIVVQSFLEHATTQIIGLALHYLRDRYAQLLVRNPRLPRRLCKPCGLEHARYNYDLGWHDLL